MGKQLGFLMDLVDEERFAQYALSSSIALWREDNIVKRSGCLPIAYGTKWWFQIFMLRNESGEATIKHTDNGIEYVDVVRSPVVEFSRTYIRHEEKEISRGRLWYENKFYINNELYMKPKELDDWYKDLCKWIKKNLPRQKIISSEGEIIEDHISQSIIELITSGYKVMN